MQEREYIIIVMVLIGVFIAIKLLMAMFRGTKKVAENVSNKSHEIAIKIKDKIDETRRNKVYNKIAESALDEIVRESVRQAMNEGKRPEDIKICQLCFGDGCPSCSNKGWELK
jgi:predicted Holliday junction resolvase-like endonuclease